MSAAILLIAQHTAEVDEELTVRMALDRELFAALSCYFYAEDAFNKQETGIACGYCQLAIVKI